jgi:hypothetical protein
LEKEVTMKNDIEEVVQEEDFEKEGYFDKKNDVVEKDDILQCLAVYLAAIDNDANEGL